MIPDRLIMRFDQILRNLCPPWEQRVHQPSPANDCEEQRLSAVERHQSIAMMRVNAAGEVAAQGLYRGQMMLARDPHLKQDLLQAANEEMDHYHWCIQRLQELQAQPSIFNSFWYFGAVSIGLVAALLHDKISLGFIIATEEQVGEHLASHLVALPKQDLKSRAVVQQMYADELEHAEYAEKQGGIVLPWLLQALMHLAAQVMIKVSRVV